MGLIGNVTELVKSFSYNPILRSNVSAPIPLPGQRASGAGKSSIQSPIALVSDRYLSTYYLKLQELSNYESTEITDTVVGLFSDYILSYLKDETNNVVTLSEDVKDGVLMTDKINEILKKLNLIEDIKLHLSDYIYYGSYSYCLNWDSHKREFKKLLYENANNLVAKYSNDGLSSFLVQSHNNKVTDVGPDSVIMLGVPTLSLVDDLSDEQKELDNELRKGNKDTLYRLKEYRGCKPLFYNVIGKLKQYLLKDQLINLLSLKDLITPLVYTVGYDRNTPVDIATKLSTNIENLINKYSDLSIIMDSNFDLNTLLDQISDNLKIVTDYNSNVANMSALDLIKVNDRINELKSDLDNDRNNLLSAVGIPESLFNGDSTKWDSIKSSQRLSSKVGYYIDGLISSIKLIACTIYSKVTMGEISPDQVKVNIFNSTEVDYNNTVNSAELVASVLDSITNIIDKGKTTVENYVGLIDNDAFIKYIIDKVHQISPECDSWFNENTVKDYLKQLKEQASAEESGGFDGGGNFGGSGW